MSVAGQVQFTIEENHIARCLSDVDCKPPLGVLTMNVTPNFTLNGTTEMDPFENFTRGLYTYGIPIICVFGLLANMLSFKVFVFTSFGNYSSSSYIAALCLSDTGFLASLFLSWLSAGRIGIKYDHSPIWCHAMIYVTYVCSFLSVWYVVLIMIDRYIVVCHSLHVAEWCTKKRARVATASVTVFALVLYCHTFFTAEVTGENCAIQFKPFMLKILSYFIYTDTFITFIIPFAIIFFLNLIVIAAIKRFQTRHVRLKDRPSKKTTDTDIDVVTPLNLLSKAQFRITRTFILLSIVMLVTNVPSHGIRFYIIVNQLVHQQDSMLLYYAQQVFQILYYFNFAVNFLLYSASSKKFRKHLTYSRIFYCGRCPRRRSHFRQNEHLYR